MFGWRTSKRILYCHNTDVYLQDVQHLIYYWLSPRDFEGNMNNDELILVVALWILMQCDDVPGYHTSGRPSWPHLQGGIS